MKDLKIWCMALVATVTLPVAAQSITINNDSIMNTIKVKELRARKSELQRLIKTEDAKRNRRIEGVTPQTQEVLNDRQDSICLDLRSQLVTVELALEELAPDKTIVNIANQINQLNQNQQTQGQQVPNQTSAQQPAKPNVGKK